jgi:hypothetical protein
MRHLGIDVTLQCIASSVVFVTVETCSNISPSSSGAFRVATTTCSAKPRPADGQIAAFRRHVTVIRNLVDSIFSIQWEPKSTHQRSRSTCRLFFRKDACYRCDVHSNILHPSWCCGYYPMNSELRYRLDYLCL